MGKTQLSILHRPTRGKDDRVDARRIAEYAFWFSDKAVVYEMPDKTLVSLRNLLADRDTLLEQIALIDDEIQRLVESD